ncbi:glycosyltransferase family 4 protein [uncultured Bacteroides sp.]|uniref:glycosyltransferase family 4 protein n=1 Tax=uncultured Bacteroides sp. TaxID=162156 RepID=UPI00082347EF|nr:glycosyltransferase family 4 protein [uncultured Bacteroides sp.]SCG93559.1 D-inositol-3-phosphate glycosyltransferase [uncultured Bacteroides sp.]
MEKINLFLIDMSEDGTVSGVTRYLETLLRGLAAHSDIDVCWIRLIHSRRRLIHRQMRVDRHMEYIIPLPLAMDSIINESFWNQKYNAVVFHIIRHLFEGKKNIILHTHTLNLIDLSLYIRSKVDCKIITHLHCIPWKGIYNRNLGHFNHLYEMAYLHSTPETDRKLILSDWEYRSYTKADRLICVTRCGADFIRKGITEVLPPMDIIPNGMDDFYEKRMVGRKKDKLIRLVYAGALSPSKGLPFILEALRGVKQRGYDNIQLQIAGGGHPRFVDSLASQYRDLDIKFWGLLPFDKLKEVYRDSDIGVIASLQEQASYVALEMAMFGLAVITTAVDGLEEMFTDGVTALKVGVTFSSGDGLKVDVKMLEDKLIELIEDKKKRQRLRYNARQMYLKKLTLEQMIERTVAVYHQLV